MANYLDEVVGAVKKLKEIGVVPKLNKAPVQKLSNLRNFSELIVKADPESIVYEEKPIVNTDYIFFGDKLNNASKRGLFVVDSLANHSMKDLVMNPDMFTKPVNSYRDMNNLRHLFSNYEDVSRNFTKDVVGALNSGLIPRNSGISYNYGKVSGGVIYNGDRQLQWKPKYGERANKSSFFMGKDYQGRSSYADGIDLYDAFFRTPVMQRIYDGRRRNNAANFIKKTPASTYYWNYKSGMNPNRKPAYKSLHEGNVYRWNKEHD